MKKTDLNALLEKLMKDVEETPEEERFEGATKAVYVAEKGIRVEAREVDFIASTADMDSDGEVVEQDFILTRYLKNPVILFAHNSRALPIGKATNVRVEGGCLRMTVQFASKAANPVAEQVFLLLKEKILKAMSIGFIPHDIRRETRDDKEIWILSKNELIESSVVPIPANQNALAELKAKALKKFNLTPPLEQGNSADGGEIEMDIKELQEENARLTDANKAASDELVALKTEHDAATAELDALKTRYESLEGLYKEARESAVKAQRGNDERDLDELAGKKMDPSEKESLLGLAAANREQYEIQLKAIRNRPDTHLREPSVLPAEPPVARELSGKTGPTFASLVANRAGLSS